MAEELLYDDQHIAFLEHIWGDGFLSPGGPEEVRRVLSGVEVAGRKVLDIGCGSGACATLIAGDFSAAHVIGIDVEEPVCTAARAKAEKTGLADRITIHKVSPGPLPFPEETFDVVFSKDSIIHIPDKAFMAREAFRVLTPGGRFAASDWLISHDGTPSQEMADYIAAEALDFAMSSPESYRQAMEEAGFTEVELVNRNPWYSDVAVKELEWLTGPERAALEKRHGEDFIAEQIDIWKKLVTVLKSGEHCPHHIRGRKPA
ncbi:methyltransferase domain-containing protein [Roseovarius aestuariivivens]|uniref:methyltransferase domain-containing protein n=1 Tax=Roseovarius aestuariivivens TaxID=1888910 RepID=UPI00108127FD|nr:methyltransferase domain-containing protein [Roseovarius aestuariivivens]